MVRSPIEPLEQGRAIIALALRRRRSEVHHNRSHDVSNILLEVGVDC